MYLNFYHLNSILMLKLDIIIKRMINHNFSYQTYFIKTILIIEKLNELSKNFQVFIYHKNFLFHLVR